MQAGGGIVLAAGEEVAGAGGVAGGDLAEAVVLVVRTEGAVVFGEVADSAEMIGERPENAVGGGDRFINVLLSEDLIDRVAIELSRVEGRGTRASAVGVEEVEDDVRVGSVEREGIGAVSCHGVPGPQFVVDIPLDGRVGKVERGRYVDRFGNPTIEDVVGVLDDFGCCTQAVFLGHLRQTVAEIPGVLGHGAGRDVGPLGAVAFVVVGVAVRAVVEKLIVAAGRVTGHRPVAVGVVGVGFVRLQGVVSGGQLARLVVRVLGRAVGADELRHAMQVVVRPLVRGEQIRAAILVRQIRQAAECVVGVA